MAGSEVLLCSRLPVFVVLFVCFCEIEEKNYGSSCIKFLSLSCEAKYGAPGQFNDIAFLLHYNQLPTIYRKVKGKLRSTESLS